eukprot:scaffold8570_cov111-Isochrysis_galbana.AAC.3
MAARTPTEAASAPAGAAARRAGSWTRTGSGWGTRGAPAASCTAAQSSGSAERLGRRPTRRRQPQLSRPAAPLARASRARRIQGLGEASAASHRPARHICRRRRCPGCAPEPVASRHTEARLRRRMRRWRGRRAGWRAAPRWPSAWPRRLEWASSSSRPAGRDAALTHWGGEVECVSPPLAALVEEVEVGALGLKRGRARPALHYHDGEAARSQAGGGCKPGGAATRDKNIDSLSSRCRHAWGTA